MVKPKKTISLVLGSGGARGLAHIGIIQWLEKNQYSIQSIAGCSMGALVGGVYALGKLEEFTDWVTAIDRVEMLRLLDLSLGQGGLVKGDRVINTLKALTGDSLIEELPIAFTAVAADIANEKEVWLRRGPIFEAIRASIALPLLFTPYECNGVQLLDGGILNPVPIAPTFGDHTDLTIAVNLSGPPDHTLRKKAALNADHKPVEPSMLTHKIGQFIDAVTASIPENFNLATTGIVNFGPSLYTVADQAFDAMQGTIARQKLAAYPPDIVLEVLRNICGTLEFDRAEQMIRFGYDLAERTLKQF